MVTILVLFCVFLAIAFIVAVISGIIAVAPIMLTIIGLLLIDCFLWKLIFRKKK